MQFDVFLSITKMLYKVHMVINSTSSNWHSDRKNIVLRMIARKANNSLKRLVKKSLLEMIDMISYQVLMTKITIISERQFLSEPWFLVNILLKTKPKIKDQKACFENPMRHIFWSYPTGLLSTIKPIDVNL